MTPSGEPVRVWLVVLMVGLMGVCVALWLGEEIPGGLPLHSEVTYGQTVPQVMRATAQVLVVTLTQGQTVDVPGTDLTIAVGQVTDFTSQGCLGGPLGCPHHAVDTRAFGLVHLQ